MRKIAIITADGEDPPLTRADLNQVDQYLDAVFRGLGIDVEFGNHFLERVNDPRNGKQITKRELALLFKKEYEKYGKPIAQMGPDKEALLTDLSSQINCPIVLRWNRRTEKLDMQAKTVMRKPNFKPNDPREKHFKVAQDVTAVFDRPMKWFWTSASEAGVRAAFQTPSKRDVSVFFEDLSGNQDRSKAQIDFKTRDQNGKMTYDDTGMGESQEIFATVSAIVKAYYEKFKPKELLFLGKGASRNRLYAILAKRLASATGGKMSTGPMGPDNTYYQVTFDTGN